MEAACINLWTMIYEFRFAKLLVLIISLLEWPDSSSKSSKTAQVCGDSDISSRHKCDICELRVIARWIIIWWVDADKGIKNILLSHMTGTLHGILINIKKNVYQNVCHMWATVSSSLDSDPPPLSSHKLFWNCGDWLTMTHKKTEVFSHRLDQIIKQQL